MVQAGNLKWLGLQMGSALRSSCRLGQIRKTGNQGQSFTWKDTMTVVLSKRTERDTEASSISTHELQAPAP